MSIANGARLDDLGPFGVLPPMDPPPPPSATPGCSNRSKPKGKHADRRTRGRFVTINTFIDATMAGLRPAERAVWLILWRDTKPEGLARTSQTSLARRAGVSDRAVRSALGRLVLLGLVTIVHRGNLRRGPSVYRVHALVRGPDHRK
jgi:hypothetical protein